MRPPSRACARLTRAGRHDTRSQPFSSAPRGALLIVGIRLLAKGPNAVQTNEDQEFAQVAEGPPPRKPPGSPQGARLHHQQAESALQGAPGLKPGGQRHDPCNRRAAASPPATERRRAHQILHLNFAGGGLPCPSCEGPFVPLVTAMSVLAALCSRCPPQRPPAPDKVSDKPPAEAPAKPELSRAQRLDELFAKLKRAGRSRRGPAHCRKHRRHLARVRQPDRRSADEMVREGGRRQALRDGARPPRSGDGSGAGLRRGMERAGHGPFPDERLQQGDGRHRQDPVARAPPFRRSLRHGQHLQGARQGQAGDGGAGEGSRRSIPPTERPRRGWASSPTTWRGKASDAAARSRRHGRRAHAARRGEALRCRSARPSRYRRYAAGWWRPACRAARPPS